MPNSAPWPDLETAAARIEARNPVIRALVHTRIPAARAEAEALAGELRRGPLHGIPYSLKDAWDTAGIPTTGGSYRHRDRVPERSSPVHDVFRDAGAVLVGKSNCSDLSLAPEASSHVGGVTRNPRDPSRTAGGSSGGAAAAVAAGMVGFDWGSDIGGSIRLPAGYCGVYGLRLSSETWPMRGEFPEAPETLRYMNGQGPIAASLDALEVVLQAATPLRTGAPRPFEARRFSLYLPRRPGRWPSFAADVTSALERTLGPVDVADLPAPEAMRDLVSGIWAAHFEELLACDPTISLREGIVGALSAVLLRGRFGARKFYPNTAELLLLIALGRITVYREREPLLARADAFRRRVNELWDSGAVLAMPTCTVPAPRPGRTTRTPAVLTCSMPGNLCDATGLTIPFGQFPDGLPRGLQLMGPPGSEATLIELARRIER